MSLSLLRTRSPAATGGIVAAVIAVVLVAVFVGSSDQRAHSAPSSAYTVSTVLVGSGGAIGGLYQPTSPSPNQATGFVLTHEDSNFIGGIPCVQLAQRGFTVLCVKSEFSQQAAVSWDSLALDVSSSVAYLRGLGTVKKVLLVGYSGGGAIMSYYQNVAQNGLAACQAAERVDPCDDDLANLPPADGVVLLDSIPGIAFSDLTALDGSVVDEKNLRVRDESRDMFAAQNGYNPDGTSDYSAAFIDRYTKAQGAREGRLIAQAQSARKQIDRGAGQFSNDAPMPVGRDDARIWEADLNLMSHTKGRYPLISPEHPDGSAPQVIRSVRVSSADPSDNAEWDSRKGGFSVDSFLSVGAIKAPALRITDDSITGIDWASSNTATVSNVGGIHSPMLIMSMTGHYWLVPSEMYYDAATHASSKTLVYVEGASHGLTPCSACATTPGEFGDTVTEIFDYLTTWTHQHFAS
jgi:hypothetical protein